MRLLKEDVPQAGPLPDSSAPDLMISNSDPGSVRIGCSLISPVSGRNTEHYLGPILAGLNVRRLALMIRVKICSAPNRPVRF